MSREPGSASLLRIKRNTETFKKNNYHNNNSMTSVERTVKNKHYIKSSEDLLNENISEYFGDIEGYDSLFSTQQLKNIDYFNFENHVFFDSAVSKVHAAYQKILNEFPYDKSEYDFEQYFLNLDGYTRYVYDNHIPKNIGYLKFDGNSEILIKDKSGSLLDDFVGQIKTGNINLNKNKFSFEFWIYVLNQTNNFGTQIIFQKKYDNDGISIYLNNLHEINSKKYCDINFIITNENQFYHCKSEIEIEKFVHVNFTTLTLKGKRQTNFYYNGKLKKSNSAGSLSKNKSFSEEFLSSNIFIGNGYDHLVSFDNSLDVTVTSGFKGYLDDFRFFINSRQQKEIAKEKNYEIHARSSLSLYLKFNEPEGDYVNNHIVLDHSGNKLHGLIRNKNQNFYSQQEISLLRQKIIGVISPLKYENDLFSPVIFPNYEKTLQSQNLLLTKAKEFDKCNPNVFWKLFPKYLFLDASDKDGFDHMFVSEESVTSSTGNNLNLFNIDKPNNSIIINVMTIWSRFFDQLKCYIDNITNILNTDYDDLNNEKQTSIILPIALKQMGFEFKEIFPDITVDKLANKNLSYEEVISQQSIRKIQNTLWKRFLINSQDYIRSKGTKKSIKSVFNSFGLDADTFIDIREFNSQNKLNMTSSFVEKNSSIKFIDFKRKEISNIETVFDQSLPANKLFFESTLYDLQTENKQIDLSEDWCVECYVKFDPLKYSSYNASQNILRIDNVGNSELPYVSLILEKDSYNQKLSKLKLYINEVNLNSQIYIGELNDVDLFDGNLHYICVNKKKLTAIQSDYTLICSKFAFGSKNIPQKKIDVSIKIENKILSLEKPKLRIGESNHYNEIDINLLSNMSFVSKFEGKISVLRLWNKSLNDKDILIHKTDMYNTGLSKIETTDIQNHLIVNIVLKENLSNIQDLLIDDAITLYNDTLNDNSSETKLIIKPQYLSFTDQAFSVEDKILFSQSTNIDYPENYNRVNINSLNDQSLMFEHDNTNTNPSYDTEMILLGGKEDIRLSIDFSSANFINKEISKLIIINDFYSKNLGNASAIFESDYQSLYELRNVFYEKLEKEINLKILYQIYKFYDNLLEDILYDAVSSKISYNGFNFVFESNISERHKYEYKMSDQRIELIDFDNYISFDSYNDRYFTPFNLQGFSRRDAIIDSDRSYIIRKTV